MQSQPDKIEKCDKFFIFFESLNFVKCRWKKLSNVLNSLE